MKPRQIKTKIDPVSIGEIKDTNKSIFAVGFNRNNLLLIVVSSSVENIDLSKAILLEQLLKHVPLGLNLNLNVINSLKS